MVGLQDIEVAWLSIWPVAREAAIRQVDGHHRFSAGIFARIEPRRRQGVLFWCRVAPRRRDDLKLNRFALGGREGLLRVLDGPVVHRLDEGGRPVGRVESYELELAGLDFFKDRLAPGGGDLALSAMHPHDQDIGLIEQGVGESLPGVIQSHRLDLEVLEALQVFGDVVSQEVLIGGFLGGLLRVPDQHADLAFFFLREALGGSLEQDQQEEDQAGDDSLQHVVSLRFTAVLFSSRFASRAYSLQRFLTSGGTCFYKTPTGLFPEQGCRSTIERASVH